MKSLPSTGLPERHPDSDNPIHGDCQEAEDGTLSQNQDKAGNEEAAIEGSAEASADSDGKGNGQQTHCYVSHSQGHYKVVCDILKVTVQIDGPANQNIAQNSQHCNDHFQDNVDHIIEEVFIPMALHGEVGAASPVSISAVQWVLGTHLKPFKVQKGFFALLLILVGSDPYYRQTMRHNISGYEDAGEGSPGVRQHRSLSKQTEHEWCP